MTANRYKVLEVSDAVNFCQCCGKTNLKRVVFIEDTQTGDVQHFGTTCATQPAKGFGLDREVKAAIKAHDGALAAVMTSAHRRYRAQGGKYDQHKPGEWTAADKALFAECVEQARQERDAFFAGFTKIK